jgi:hypothetical protein
MNQFIVNNKRLNKTQLRYLLVNSVVWKAVAANAPGADAIGSLLRLAFLAEKND